MAEFETIIKDGMVIDGARTPRYQADIGITNGRIAKIGRLPSSDGAQVLDAGGLIVAPGVIDLHTHYDAQVFWDPWCSVSSWHGVTSVVIGNCGFGFAPVRPEARDRAMLTMTRVEAIPFESMKAGLPWDWVTFPQFLDSLERQPKGINMLPYVPVAPLLVWVMGLEAAKTRKPTDTEEAEICRLLDEAMEAGGCGWSAQRNYPGTVAAVQLDYDGTPMVTDVMADETCVALARVLGKRNEGFIQLTLFSGSREHDFAHCEELARVSGRPVIYNAIVADPRVPNNHRIQIEWLEKCRKKGLRVYGQGVTGAGGITFSLGDGFNLFDEALPWREATLGSREEVKAKLADPKRREGLRNAHPKIFVIDLGSITVVKAYRQDLQRYENQTLHDIARGENKHIFDVLLDISVADDLRTEFFAESFNGKAYFDLLKEIYDYPYLIPGVSDGGAHTKFFVGAKYPTDMLIDTRDQQMLTLEEAHWRLSALPAWCAGFR
ncbi:MAG: N-acyl-D-amino-acid deacylase family protein, partial [Candidatus Binatia bacterium]